MAKLDEGHEAEYDPNKQKFGEKTECHWCTGTSGAVLSSSSFNSCVGLVLHRGFGEQFAGAVAHFPGTMGGSRSYTRADIKAIFEKLEELYGVTASPWKAWIFGGMNLDVTGDSPSSQKLTTNLLGFVRKALPAEAVPVASKSGKNVAAMVVELDVGSGLIRLYKDNAKIKAVLDPW